MRNGGKEGNNASQVRNDDKRTTAMRSSSSSSSSSSTSVNNNNNNNNNNNKSSSSSLFLLFLMGVSSLVVTTTMSSYSILLDSNGGAATRAVLVGLYSVVVTASALRPASTSSSSKKTSIFKRISSKVVAKTRRTKRGYRNGGADDGSDGGSDTDTNNDDDDDNSRMGSRKKFGVRLETMIDENNNRNNRKEYAYVPSLLLTKRKRQQRKKLKQQQQHKVPIETVEELRRAVLDYQLNLSDTIIVENRNESRVPSTSLPPPETTDDTDTDRKRSDETSAVAVATSITQEDNDQQQQPEEQDTSSSSSSSSSSGFLMDHAVRNLMKERYVAGSTPGHRNTTLDPSTLAIAIEGGGMRGSVSAGMVAAITALGLSDTIDTIYGSSAGSVVGAYMVSRQVCLDVYVDILPASKKLFVCKTRMMKNLASSVGRLLIDRRTSKKLKRTRTATSGRSDGEDGTALTPNNNRSNSRSHNNGLATSSSSSSSTTSSSLSSLSLLRERLAQTPPGMNISYVLDGILDPHQGLRPLDIAAFHTNIQKQKLRVVSSCVDPNGHPNGGGDGTLSSKCFGIDDFFHEEDALVEYDHDRDHEDDTNNDNEKQTPTNNSRSRSSTLREGLFACLQASMTVPGATGPPVNLISKKNRTSTSNNNTNHNTNNNKIQPIACFDAFCFEPIPYRSAVEEGATHVLVLTTRPHDYQLLTQPSIYETSVAPLYFHSHGYPTVAKFFARGGQQYLYAEDLLLLEESKQQKVPIASSSSSSSSLSSTLKENAQQQQQGVLVPPPTILYGIPTTTDIEHSIAGRAKQWKRAHLFPLTVPAGHQELDVLEQDQEAVLAAIRGGFETAFDSLSDLVGLETLKGKEVAELFFPDSSLNEQPVSASSSTTPTWEEQLLETKIHVPGEPIPECNQNSNNAAADKITDNKHVFDKNTAAMIGSRGGLFGYGNHNYDDNDDDDDDSNNDKNNTSRMNQNHLQQKQELAKVVLDCLPGFQEGRYGHLAKGLREGN